MAIDPITQMLKNIDRDRDTEMEMGLQSPQFNYEYSGWMDGMQHVPEHVMKSIMMELANGYADDPEIVAFVEPLCGNDSGISTVDAIVILMQCAWYLNEIERVKERHVEPSVVRVRRDGSNGTVNGHSWHSR